MLLMLNVQVPLIYLIAAIPYAWLGLIAWRKRPALAVTPFAWVMVGMSLWSFVYSLELFFPNTIIKIICTQFEYIGIVAVPVYMLFFAFEYTGSSHLLTPRIKLLIWILPILTLILVWTNPFHHLMWNGESIMASHGLLLLSLHYKWMFWAHTLYSYALLLIASIMLIMELLHRAGIYRVQISFVILSILFPLVGSVIYVTGAGPIEDLDLTPLFFLPTALGLFWAIFKYHLLDILPPEQSAMIKNMKDGVVVLDAEQRILYINPIAGELFHDDDGETLGQPLIHVSAPFFNELKPYLYMGEGQGEIKIEDDDGEKVYEVNVSPIFPLRQDAQGNVNSMVILHDITERSEAETALSRREAIMSSISHAAESFLKISTWEQNIPNVLEKLGRAAEASRVILAVNYLGEDRVLYSSLCYEWSAEGIEPQIDNPNLQHVPLTQAGFKRWERTLSHGVSIHGLVRDFPVEEQQFLKQLGSLSIAVIPIFAERYWWGFLMFDQCLKERLWTDIELDAFNAAASIIGATEARARAEQKVARRQKALDMLNRIVKTSLQADSVVGMAQTVVDNLGKLIGADGCFITLWSETEQHTIPVAAYGIDSAEYSSFSIKPGQHTFTDSVLQIGHTLIIEDIENTPYADVEVTKNFPSVSVLVLPLIANQKKLGAVLLSFDTRHEFTSDEISISEQAGDLIALALEKFQAVDDARRRADTSETLRKAGMAVAKQLKLNEAVNHILVQLNQVLPYDSASVQMLEETDGQKELAIVGGRGWENPNDVIGVRFKIPGPNPNSVVIETGKPYRLTEAAKAYEEFRHPPHDHIHSWLGVPLIVNERIIGLLAADSAENNHFKEEDINVAMEFANQVAVALDNARLYQETQTQALTDALTGVYNRRGLFQLGEFEFQRSRRINRPFSLLMFDIDHFKKVNDQHGHPVGDQVLLQLAQRCLRNSRTTDLVCRYGGEEFVVLLTETNLEAASFIAERLRISIMSNPFTTDTGEIRITSSIGVAEAKKKDDLHSLIERADEALYLAKNAGRNQVIVVR